MVELADLEKRWHARITAQAAVAVGSYRKGDWDPGYDWNDRDGDERKRKKGEPQPPDIAGGFGWDPRRFPHPECPRCFGEGVLETYFKDTRKLSEGGKRLFTGVAETRDGMKVLTADKQTALRVLASHVGITEKQEHSGPNGGPIPVQPMKEISAAEYEKRRERARAVLHADRDDDL